MSYIKLFEEWLWKRWKMAEESILRDFGMEETKIQDLREYDWGIFKTERCYREREILTNLLLHLEMAKSELLHVPRYIEVDMLERLRIRELFELLVKTGIDRKTIGIIWLRIQGYTTTEIAERLTLTAKAVYRREERLREKIKKFLKNEGKISDFVG
ncbi:sigma-70 family RNA polymerase sigma factor [Sporofaciens sp. SGI.106]|uniref:sigma-70 family RNA polymerase sigma factor n=1 Tax=Sporofaciens sp. SGI.106 TaxID=3420568 RepID=UPI002A9A7388|nr:sigma-70 family RNA polymerase sigma factor [Lachnoclostridium sp.]